MTPLVQVLQAGEEASGDGVRPVTKASALHDGEREVERLGNRG
ncbi:hypothetical protein ACFVXE_04060 [Streptomyces sp. NPDC058231]